MSDQDRGQRFVRAPGGFQALEGFLAADAGVDQETGSLGGNQSRIAAAGRREDGNFNDVSAAPTGDRFPRSAFSLSAFCAVKYSPGNAGR
ncbi:MAG TPA: hypothetical protein VN841_04915 [Bryobacteraceae bacterium]|nr:hypothetical protein [Bryobacteraceae bacterium]